MAFESIGSVAFDLANKVSDLETENNVNKEALRQIANAINNHTAGSSRTTFDNIKAILSMVK